MLGLTDDHVALHETARRWAAAHCSPAVARAAMESETEELPPFWSDLAAMGWLGLHLPAEHGGEGFGPAELVVVIEELGRAGAPGPFLPTVLAGAVIDALGTDEQRARWLPGIADGSCPAAVAFAGDLVLGGGLARLVVVPVGDGRWRVIDDPVVSAHPSTDATRRVATLAADPSEAEVLGGGGGGDGDAVVERLVATFFAAECSGGAAWCVETAAAYAQIREQFGRPIGQFQAVKHRCADMLCALEQARAAAWDAVRPGDPDELALAAAVAGALAPDAFFRCAKDCIQVLGGIGFTWEHDAHLYLKRAMAVRALVGDAHRWRPRVLASARAGVRRTVTVDLPPEAEPMRDAVRSFLGELKEHDKGEWRRLLADAGYIAPHWPRPWGRDANPLEQLVIDEEFRAARVRRPHLQVGAWVLPTLVAHGSPDQQERWIPPTLRGELRWCQLFSEPGAGSDLASLATKASRVDGGWLLTGQKVWTTMAHTADWGICLARTDPSAPKHDGITCFMVDMRAEGLDVRPLRELTGEALFNEVFLSDVFVPDDCVVGGVDNGWRAARTTLENERVSMGSGSSFGLGVEGVLALVDSSGAADDPVAVDDVAALVVTAQSLAALGLRLTLRALSGAQPGPESSVRKLLGVEHDQRVQEVGLTLLGAAGAAVDGDAAGWVAGFLANRCLTIAGGTSEVQRNVIAERLLGLPKDP